MGTNVEVHTEVKVRGKWHHYGCPSIPRDYTLFAKMSGERYDPSYLFKPLSPKVGMPVDATDLTKFASENRGVISGATYVLDASLIEQLIEWWQTRDWVAAPIEFEQYFDYLLHNDWRCRSLVEDVRFIFWYC
jgi:hypothetical protein